MRTQDVQRPRSGLTTDFSQCLAMVFFDRRARSDAMAAERPTDFLARQVAFWNRRRDDSNRFGRRNHATTAAGTAATSSAGLSA